MTTFRLYGCGEIYDTARILSRIGFISGFQTQDFATHSHNKLAPVTAFVRFDKEKILSKSPVTEPDFLLVYSTDNITDVLKDAKSETILIINSKETPKLSKKNKANAYYVDATSISFNKLKNDSSASALLGALVKVFNKISLKSAKEAINQELKELRTENISIMEEGFKSVKK